jgi:1-deoxy-D-xylulose-5-phosphate synthase
VEEGVKKGGLGSAVLEFLAKNGYQNIQVIQVGIDDRFVTHGTMPELHAMTGTDEAGILATIRQVEQAIEEEKITEFIQR